MTTKTQRERSRTASVPWLHELVRHSHHAHHLTARPHSPGASPGTLFPNPKALPTAVYWFRYGPDNVEEGRLDDTRGLASLDTGPGHVLWLDVRGLQDRALFAELGRRFDIHPLAVADMVNVPQRAKTEAYEQHTLCIAHMAQMTPEGLHHEQVSLLVGRGLVVTVQERDSDGDVLEPVRQRIRTSPGRLRRAGADYLAYAILDATVDAWFPVLDRIGEDLETLEVAVLQAPRRTAGRQIHALKRTLLLIRRMTWPQRDALSALLRGEGEQMTATTLVYLRDAHDHSVHVVDTVETYREFASSLMDLYLSSVNHRMNEVVKVLTIISTIFLPLSVVAGIYGMNFDPDASPWNMPELRWTFGYPFALGLMAAIAAVMLLGFWRAGWLGGSGEARGSRLL